MADDAKTLCVFKEMNLEYLQTVYHIRRTWYPSGGIGRLDFCGVRENQMRDVIMSVFHRHYNIHLSGVSMADP